MQYLILLALLLMIIIGASVIGASVIGACTAYVVAQNHVYK